VARRSFVFWCDRMDAAAAGRIENECDGYAAVHVTYQSEELRGILGGDYCQACADALAGDGRLILSVKGI
jgi:hypothetical protein